MILLTGGSGRLGTELRKILKPKTFIAPTRKELDILGDLLPEGFDNIDLIVHCAAYTYVPEGEVDHANCYAINVTGTRNLSQLGIPMLYISTEHVFDGKQGNYKEWETPNPANYYALTKLLGEHVLNDQSKIIRLSLKPRPFPYPKAFVDQWTTASYVDEIAKEVAKAIELFEFLPKITHIGVKRKSLYQLAKETREVEPISRLEVSNPAPPKDTSLCLDRWNRIRRQYDPSIKA